MTSSIASQENAIDSSHDGTARKTGQQRARLRESMTAYLFILPTLLAFVLFMALPMVLTAILSLYEWTGISLETLTFVGLDNYERLFQDPVFYTALGNNLVVIVLGTVLSVGLGLFLAVLLERALPGSNFFRGLFFMPTVISGVVIAIVFTFLLSPVFGVLPPFFALFGIDFETALLGDPSTVLYTIIGIQVWRTFGFAMFLFVAGLKALDETLDEAAKIDGANGWQIFWNITFPQLRPVTLLVATLVGIDGLKLFDVVFIMTLGGPQNASEVLATYSYSQGFQFNAVGFGSSIALVLLIITFILTIVRFRLLPDEAKPQKKKVAR
ncbi:MAG: sugar ABC transporter permease [Microcella sp.]|uniref:carbohydrate ABC transporter permease n=1 Tax=Microcella sp. TaxID=1913979 RepID=UPI00331463DE